MNKKAFSSVVFAFAGIIILIFLANSAVREKAIPSLSEYMALSSASVVVSTSTADALASIDQVMNMVSISVRKGGKIQAFVAADPASREKGLGDRQSMPAREGMLFVFDQPEIYSFWMKDMEFPLDMIWIGADKTVVGVTSDIATSTYPNTFASPAPVKYVLELNAGKAAAFGIATGTTLAF